MTDQTRPPVLKRFFGKGRHQRGQFGVNRLFDQLARTIADDIREWVDAKSRWIGELAQLRGT